MAKRRKTAAKKARKTTASKKRKAARKPSTRRAGSRRTAPVRETERNEGIRRAWAAFAHNIPAAALSAGHFKPEGAATSSTAFSDTKVPNGTYRVEGADWLLTFKGGAFVEAHHAPKHVDIKAISVPAHDGPEVSVAQ